MVEENKDTVKEVTKLSVHPNVENIIFYLMFIVPNVSMQPCNKRLNEEVRDLFFKRFRH